MWAGYPVCPSFFPCWGPQTCWTSQPWHHATDGMHVTGSPWWQHFISAIMLSVFSGYLRFGLLITQFLDFKLSALVFEAFQTVWMERIDGKCSASVRQIQGESEVKRLPSWSLCKGFGEGIYCQTIMPSPSAFFMSALLSQRDQCDDSQHQTVFTSTWKTPAIHIASNHSGTASHRRLNHF